ncbi:hypothetical protein A1O1_04312 [Capronia coronata CBS 617.96]|uniref:Uncharacterized protein n=1 Tax=Capronia coronata CBS 617.96 TaxID=1182541 RepID=W9YF71_9EURO|nr:uncharacterized protein A1O1_04312 [Capronia coronata CBS 617.96]EXJ91203.1 hypothetical protein A1O1_04312 [Capronia coronata CBS 617.96]
MPPTEKASLQASAYSSTTPQDLPPSYENIILPIHTPGPSTPSLAVPIPSQNALEALSRLTAIDFPKYCVAESKLSEDLATVTTTKPELALTQYALVKFIHEQAALPPKPLMVIRGTHVSGLAGSAKYGEPTVDFELKINLTSLLEIDHGAGLDASRSSNRIRVKPPEHSSSSSSPKPASGSRSGRESTLSPLEQWVKKFCEDKAENRSFTIRRSANNLPTPILEGMVRTLIAATKYRGKVSVEFPVHHADVTVLRQSGNWFTNMLQLYRTKRYDVVESVWDVVGTNGRSAGNGAFAGEGRSDAGATSPLGGGEGSSTSTEHNRRVALIAQEWWREWQSAIWNAVLARRQGWVTIEDWFEARMGVREKERTREWGIDHEQST